MTTKITITDRINAIEFDSMTEEDFAFLVERALKSVRPASNGPRKPSKASLEHRALTEKVVEFIGEAENPVTCQDICEAFNVSTHKAARLLSDAVKNFGISKNEAKGKNKATWFVA